MEPEPTIETMCMIVELAKEKNCQIPEADKICKDWQEARMQALSTLPYEEVNRVLQAIDDRFNDFLDYAIYYANQNQMKAAS